ncbi:hypothetical protein LCGC14_0887580 [marine sediment metagenome]|uniref:Uncharacterized protein n=1 Tax=marine sediment metagenome TaxID=412755 RepID=A0A0F9P058_9ZZZZ
MILSQSFLNSNLEDVHFCHNLLKSIFSEKKIFSLTSLKFLADINFRYNPILNTIQIKSEGKLVNYH